MTPRRRRRQHPYLASARAYYRLAAKSFRAGEWAQSEAYRKTAERRMAQYRAAMRSAHQIT